MMVLAPNRSTARRSTSKNEQSSDLNGLPETGERLHADAVTPNALEHLHRYAFAASLCTGKDVLDIASGEGYGSHLLASRARTVTGVDISERAVAHARGKYHQANLKYLQGSAAKIPLLGHGIDVVVSFETIEHHDQHEEMMLEIRRVLRPGGLLIISSPDKRNYSDVPNFRNEYHVKELYLDEFHALLRRHFAHTRMLFQRVVLGSFIYPEAPISQFEYFTGDFSSFKVAVGPEAPLYNICIASDVEATIPVVGTSIFDSSHLLSRLTDESARLDARVAALGQEIQTLKGSVSFRLGRALTSPLRWFRRR